MGEYTPDQPQTSLPDSKSPSLHLTHPTVSERLATWKLNSANWGAALETSEYLEREEYLMTVPLARDSGMTHWILVDRDLPPNNRPILCSSESLRKPVLVAKNGEIRAGITHGIGSVFCNPEYRSKGYASRMLKDLGQILKDWQVSAEDETVTVPFSILYSDIGKKYYSNFGWNAFPSTHLEFPPTALPATGNVAKALTDADLAPLCTIDEQQLRSSLQSSTRNGKTQVALIPNHDTMRWHHSREDFLTNKLFGKSPTIRGAISGSLGSRVWAIWTRSFYGPLVEKSGNTLHFLRLVVEDQQASASNAGKLKAILELAQHEAREWKLNHVEIWNPTPLTRELVLDAAVEYKEEDRQNESIASLMWYGDQADNVEWVLNEKFGWC